MFNKYTVKDYYEKLDNLNPETTQLLNDFYRCPDSEEYQLNVIKCKRPKLKAGDVFLVNPFKDIYFYGLVLNAEPNGNHTAIGKTIADICIFSDHIKGPYEGNELPELKQENVLVLPTIVSRSCWTSGYFYNVGNVGDDRGFKYAFFHTSKDIFVNCKGEPILELPDIVGMNAFTTMSGISTDIYEGILLQLCNES